MFIDLMLYPALKHDITISRTRPLMNKINKEIDE